MLVPLTILATFLLATGRWGAYLGFPAASVFITEVGLGLTAVWVLVRHRRSFVAARLRPLVPVLALLGWASVRFTAGGNFDLIAARDLAPYAYAVAILAAAFVVSSYRRTLGLVAAGLLSHLLWVLFALLLPAATAHLPLLGGRVRVLEIRADFDSAVLAVTAGMALLWAARSQTTPKGMRAAACAVAVLSGALVFELGSRSGVLTLSVVTAILALSQSHLLRRLSWQQAVAIVVLLAALAVVLLPQTYVFERATADPRRSEAGAGTVNARQRAWELVIEDANQSPERLLLGSGFGRDFLDLSGARVTLEGNVNTGVRAPHNFVLNTLGRLGLVGVLLLAWVSLALGRASLRARKATVVPFQGPFLSFAVLLVAALGTASMVGVILESPFGAVPFWWAAGFLLAGTARPASRHRDTGDGSEQQSVTAAP